VTVSILRSPGVRYPAQGEFFSPSERFPEYSHDHLAAAPNAVYPMVRQLLFDAGLDREHFGRPEWNPLARYVKPGASVFVLCNFVYHRRPQESELEQFSKCIHGSVLRALVDYVLIAAGPRGRVRFGNSPLQGARWADVLQQTGAAHAAEFYRVRGLPVQPLDLRQYVVDRSLLGNVRHIERRDRAEDVVEVDLGADSLLSPLADGEAPPRFRVMDYEPKRTEAFHAGHSHRYVIHRAVLEADTVISLSKLKTHEKVGITCGLKGYVGTVAQKDCLAHHRFGSPGVGGDEYPEKLWFLRPVSQFQNWLSGRGQDAALQKPMQVADWTIRRVLKRTGLRMAGAWHGNDTAWRMSLDLGRIVHHADTQGRMHEGLQRTNLSLIDGIVGGEGEGPLAPEPIHSGALLFSDDVAVGDRVACHLMGFNPQAIPLIREAFAPMSYPLTSASLAPVEVVLNGVRQLETEVMPDQPFVPAPGWLEHLAPPPRTLAGNVRALVSASEIEACAHSYSIASDTHGEQLRLLNLEWRRLLGEHSYYQRLRREGLVPSSFDSLQAFIDGVPVTTREAIRAHGDEMASEHRASEFTRMTGGSTSQPVRLPAWKSEQAVIQAPMWWSRSWYGVTPASRLFLLWGHSHLLGKGMQGFIKAQRLKTADRLLGYHRFSAYDLRPEALHRAAEELIAFQPEYMIGYSVALDRFARANDGQRRALRALGLKVVIATAEGFPSPDSASRLEDLFGCPVAMEYGCVEAGPMAHLRPAGGYAVFWRQYLLEGERTAAGHRVRVTSLYPRCFPLVRYDLGDEVALTEAADRVVGITAIDRVIGRCNDSIELPDGAVIHSEVFSHAVRPCAEIDGFQIVHADGRDFRLRYMSPAALSIAAEQGIRERLGKAHPLLGVIVLERVEALDQTVAGKTRMVVSATG
jgi:phenylacetate-CoA ligase